MLKVTPFAGGTLVVIPLAEIQDSIVNNEAYLIFRVLHKSLNEAFKPKLSVGNIMERLVQLVLSPVTSTRYSYSVRINEMRVLPSEVTAIGAFHRQRLNKAVITLTLNESYDVKDANCYRIRRLEENLYKEYMPEGFPSESALTYQWNQTREENLRGHFNFYFNISQDALKKGSLLVYMLLVLIIGAAGNALWSAFCALFGWTC